MKDDSAHFAGRLQWWRPDGSSSNCTFGNCGTDGGISRAVIIQTKYYLPMHTSTRIVGRVFGRKVTWRSSTKAWAGRTGRTRGSGRTSITLGRRLALTAGGQDQGC